MTRTIDHPQRAIARSLPGRMLNVSDESVIQEVAMKSRALIGLLVVGLVVGFLVVPASPLMPGVMDTVESSSASVPGSGGGLRIPITGTRRRTIRPLSCSRSRRYTCSRRLRLLQRPLVTGITARAPETTTHRFRAVRNRGCGCPRETRDGTTDCSADRGLSSPDRLRDSADGTERARAARHREELRAVSGR